MNEDLAGELSQQNPLIKFLVTSVEELKQGLKALDEKFEARLHDTRPLWERIVGEIDKLRLGQESMRVELTELRTDINELRTGQEGMRVELTELRTDINELGTGQEGMRAELTELRIGQTSIREELVKINYHLKLIDGKLKSAFGEIGDLRADFTVKMAEVENRLPKLEQP